MAFWTPQTKFGPLGWISTRLSVTSGFTGPWRKRVLSETRVDRTRWGVRMLYCDVDGAWRQEKGWTKRNEVKLKSVDDTSYYLSKQCVEKYRRWSISKKIEMSAWNNECLAPHPYALHVSVSCLACLVTLHFMFPLIILDTMNFRVLYTIPSVKTCTDYMAHEFSGGKMTSRRS